MCCSVQSLKSTVHAGLGVDTWRYAAGAFPEVQVPQYPLDMGKKDGAKSSSTLAVSVNNQGGINYDAILKQGKNRDKLIASDHSAMVPKVDKVAGGVSPDTQSVGPCGWCDQVVACLGCFGCIRCPAKPDSMRRHEAELHAFEESSQLRH